MPKVNPITLNQMVRAKRSFQMNESKCVANIDYDEESETLKVDFNQRGTYEYHDVPLDVFVDFASAGSQGQYFNNYIRNTYSYERIG